jgi:hypothetical protein
MLGRAAFAISVVALSVTAAGAAPAARNGQVLYLRPLGGNAPPWGHFFAASACGAGARDITPAGIQDVQGAAWSPSGRRIAIQALPRPGPGSTLAQRGTAVEMAVSSTPGVAVGEADANARHAPNAGATSAPTRTTAFRPR